MASSASVARVYNDGSTGYRETITTLLSPSPFSDAAGLGRALVLRSPAIANNVNEVNALHGWSLQVNCGYTVLISSLVLYSFSCDQ